MHLFGLIGYPLDHSRSDQYFTEKFAREGLQDHAYRHFPLANISELASLLSKHTELRGLNVTSPYKTLVIPFLQDLDATARALGAVNTIAIHRRDDHIMLAGYNTDVYGFQSLLSDHWIGSVRKALILGTGGAARAVRYALGLLGIESSMVSRSPVQPGQLAYSSLDDELVQEVQLIVNATPVGQFPHIHDYPDFPYHSLRKTHLVIDLIYNPPLTAFLQKAEKQRARTLNGLKMLENQAEKAWEIWTLTPSESPE